MKHIILAVIITGIVALTAPTTYACSCVMPDVHDAYDRASDVFVGVITEIIEPRASGEKASPSERFFTIKFKVEKSWKGRFSPEISVLADQGRLGCFSYPTVFKGERYLVYADPLFSDDGYVKDLVTINACNRTGLINEQLKRPVFNSEFTDWFGRMYRTEDLKELEEITGAKFKFQFNRPPSKSKGESGLKIGW